MSIDSIVKYHNQNNLSTLKPNVWDYTGYLVVSFARTKKLIATQMNLYLKRNTTISTGTNLYIKIIFTVPCIHFTVLGKNFHP